MGFFSPGNSTKRYFGIWFAKLTQQTVVWTANSESPLYGSSGVFMISSDGNFMVVDGKRDKVLWSSNLLVSSNNSIGELLDSGNLVLRAREKVLWQSFDHPTDTFLAGMKFGLNVRTGENQLLTAWKSIDDPSPGNFTLGFDPNKIAQIIIWNGSKRIWRSGQWNGQMFTGIPGMTSFHLYGFNIIYDDDEGKLYCIYTDKDNSTVSRFVLSPQGKLERLYWNASLSDWDLTWLEPYDECDTYGKCGPNGYCNQYVTPMCCCHPGFRPLDPREWDSGNWSGGCVRKKELKCSNGSVSDGFLKLSGIKLPDISKTILSIDRDYICEAACTSNCSCVAYAYDTTGLGCLVWDGDIKDVRKFSNGGQDVYLRLDKSDLKRPKKWTLLIPALVLATLGVAVVLLYSFTTWRRVRRKREGIQKDSQELHFLDQGSAKNSNRNYLDQTELDDGINNGKSPDLPTFGLDSIQIATNGFSFANKLGQGGFGPVYKGKLSSGQEIAVKRLSKGSGQGMMEFENEVILIAKLQHRNLVRLLGCCMQGEERMLIYEYMPNKSLDAFLFDRTKRVHLDWRTRFNIIEGIARGLLYLHRDSRLRIIHRDLKASNILLDADMNPKISDFGMARIFCGNKNQENTMKVVGTYGYLAPEYAMEGLFSVKSDVFSFGVILLEILSGKRNSSFCHPDKAINLLGHAWEVWSESRMLDLLDPMMQNLPSTTEVVMRYVKVGLLCVQDDPSDRPTMDVIMFMLGSDAAVFPMPKKPAFSTGRTTRESDDQQASSSEICSANAVTISTIHGR
ncbi:hypothetical protein Scep_013221 [Stephania cephalantha]|uniref:Receptor-like serine/threonine-protein kinase n=1 Tax=Stephania cephalantha TaxID=152367 RepID=A0AAP0JGM4_9MAGN